MKNFPCLVEAATLHEVMDVAIQNAKNEAIFVEVGSFLGGTLCYLGQKIKESGKNILVYGIDTWEYNPLKDKQTKEELGILLNDNFTHMHIQSGDDIKSICMNNIINAGVEDIVKLIHKDSLVAVHDFADKSVSLLFLDGCHSYPYTKNEIQEWLPKMAKDSTLCGHDFGGGWGVDQAVQEIFGTNYKLTSSTSTYIVKIGNGLI
jgi:hypothetical protein